MLLEDYSDQKLATNFHCHEAPFNLSVSPSQHWGYFGAGVCRDRLSSLWLFFAIQRSVWLKSNNTLLPIFKNEMRRADTIPLTVETDIFRYTVICFTVIMCFEADPIGTDAGEVDCWPVSPVSFSRRKINRSSFFDISSSSGISIVIFTF